jgi:hypothetical protein
VPCWDGGAAQQPEDEREQQHAWESDGDLPWEPERTGRPGERFMDCENWPEHLAGPEYEAWKRKRDEERGP